MKGYWRGPVWLDQFAFGTEGLRRYGYGKLAAALEAKLLANAEGLTGNQPIYENYHPLTGKGLNARNFSWSAAHLLMILKTSNEHAIHSKRSAAAGTEKLPACGGSGNASGYDEYNYKLTDASGRKFILKITGEEKPYSFLDAQLRLLDHLTVSPVAWKFQQILRNKNRQELTPVFNNGKQYNVRILTWLDGDCWVHVKDKPKSLYTGLGHFLGKTDESLQDFQHDALHRPYVWDVNTAADANRLLHCITDPEKRRLAGYFLLAFETEVLPVLTSLRHACIHNDANDYNVLVKQGEVSGLIDLGIWCIPRWSTTWPSAAPMPC